MNAGEPAGSEEIRFEDLDLVLIISFDLGAPIEVKDPIELLDLLSGIFEMVEGIWIPLRELGLHHNLSIVRRRSWGSRMRSTMCLKKKKIRIILK
ncbi:MAG: hypothetical protein DSO07_05350 [Thermoproteota archaeon]|jgi:hypothetical protein|nr:MAG: hypothetical protein DSO07_05350 [Candidatus Korarchaeota archaeon]